METRNAKQEKLRMDRGWKWLVYIDGVLPLLLFLLALVPLAGVGRSFARLFHTYGLYIMSTVPDFSGYTGILGLLIHAWVLLWAGLKRRWVDLAICAAIATLVTLYFLLGWNYAVSGLLDFGL